MDRHKSRFVDAGPSPEAGWKRWLVSCLVGAAVSSSGCSLTGPREWFCNGFKVGPEYCRPLAPAADQWIEAADARTQGVLPGDDNWWKVFGDPTLDALIIRAYEQNPDLRAVGTRVLQARAQQAIAVGSFFPQTQDIVGVYPHGVHGGVPIHVDATVLNLSWELDFWGKYRRQIESANARVDSTVENYDAALVSLLADLASNYIQYRVAQQRIEIARDNLEKQEALVALAERQEQVGTSTRLDVAQLRTLSEQTRSMIPALKIVQGQANDRICILVGDPPRDLEPELGPGPTLGGLPTPQLPASVAAGIPADLLVRRPDVRSAERQAAAQCAQIGVAEAELFPSMSIAALLGHADLDLGPSLVANGGLAAIRPQFSWKVFNYGRLMNNVHLQDARTQDLIATYQNTVLRAAQEVQTSLRAFMRSQEQAADLARSAAAAVEATSIEERHFREVKADANRLFILENSRLQAQEQFAVAQGNIALSLINVYRALGGGWELRLQFVDDENAEPTFIPTEPNVVPHEPIAVPPEPPPQ